MKAVDEKNKNYFAGNQNISQNISKIIKLVVRERVSKYFEINQMIDDGEFAYYIESPIVNKLDLICPERMRKGKDVSFDIVKTHLEDVEKLLEKISEENWTVENIKNGVWDYATEQGRGVVLWALRYSLSGREKSPDPFIFSFILGKTKALSRIKYAQSL